jgi:hypothetical protein
MVGLQSLDLPIGVRIPVSQPFRFWILDFGFWINRLFFQIRNLKTNQFFPSI